MPGTAGNATVRATTGSTSGTAFVAVTVGRSSPEASNAYGLTPFVATRPLSTAAIAAVKLRMALAMKLAGG